MKMNINNLNSNLDTVEYQELGNFECFTVQETFLFWFFSASTGRESKRDRNLDICGKGSVIISHYRSLQSGLLKISSHPQFFPEVFLLPTSSAMNECRHHMDTCLLPGCVWVFWGSAQIPADGSDWHFFSEPEEKKTKKKKKSNRATLPF